jgi:hypothetical protein
MQSEQRHIELRVAYPDHPSTPLPIVRPYLRSLSDAARMISMLFWLEPTFP